MAQMRSFHVDIQFFWERHARTFSWRNHDDRGSGNRLNQGTEAGEVAAFDLDLLSQLHGIKGADGSLAVSHTIL